MTQIEHKNSEGEWISVETGCIGTLLKVSNENGEACCHESPCNGLLLDRGTVKFLINALVNVRDNMPSGKARDQANKT